MLENEKEQKWNSLEKMLYYSCITSTEKNNLGNMFIISKDLQTILCGVTIDEEEFLLVTPAEDGTTANNMKNNMGKKWK